VNIPPNQDRIADESGRPSRAFVRWFTEIFTFLSSIDQSGTTANRPTANLWVGRFYFDTTLGQPIWVKTTSPVVWVDATGSTV